MKILFVRLSSLGDVALATGVCTWAKKQIPQCEIHFLTKPEFAFIPRHCSSVDKTLFWDGKSSFFSFVRDLESYDFVFDLQGKLRSRALQVKYLFRYSCYKKEAFSRRCLVAHSFLKSRWKVSKKNKYLSANEKQRNERDDFRKQEIKHVVEKYADVVSYRFKLPLPDREELAPRLEKPSENMVSSHLKNLLPSKYLAINPFASHRTKEWPKAFEFCKILLTKNIAPVIVGRGETRDWPKGTLDLTNKTSPEELLWVLSQAEAVVSTDSGPLHLAIGLRRPSLALFGSTVWEFGFAPMFKNTDWIEVNGLSCRPCHVHGRKECPLGHFSCMEEISVEKVFSKIAPFIV